MQTNSKLSLEKEKPLPRDISSVTDTRYYRSVAEHQEYEQLQ